MAAFEAEVAPALFRLLETGRFQNDEDRILVMNLIGTMAMRNPRLREVWRDFHERVSYVILDILTANKDRWERHLEKMKRDGYEPGHEVPYDNVRKMVEEKGFKLELQNEAHIKMEVHSLDTLLPLLICRKWMILRAPLASPGFLTSDDPVCLTLDDPEFRGGLYRPGFGLRNTSVTVPLGRHLAIVGKFEGQEECLPINEKGVAHVNSIIIAHSDRRVFAADNHFFYMSGMDEELRPASKLPTDAHFRPRKKNS